MNTEIINLVQQCHNKYPRLRGEYWAWFDGLLETCTISNAQYDLLHTMGPSEMYDALDRYAPDAAQEETG